MTNVSLGKSPIVAMHGFWRVLLLRRLFAPLALLGIAAAGVWAADPLVSWRTETATFAIDAKGSWCRISRNSDGRDYLASGQPSPLLCLRLAGTVHAPDGAAWDAGTKRLNLRYMKADASAIVSVQPKPTHLAFELVAVNPVERVEVVIWGPYPTTIGQTIGETIGVVRDHEFALGIQSLNAKTLGGYPSQENDIENDFTADDHGTYLNLPAALLKDQGFRGDTARPKGFGSVLQAYSRNRERARIIPNWGHDKYLAPAFHDGGVVGSRIALFGCPAGQVLKTIGEIEVAEGLPHPILDGQWGKTSPTATAAYLIVDFGESTIDRAIAMTRRAGLKYLYHSSPFETWGHFKLKPSLFPHGWDGFRACVEKGQQAGIRLGLHTLSNFITPNDPYVTPVPDGRLARIGTSELEQAIDASQKEIAVAAPDYFTKKTALNTVVIDQELIRYAAVSTNAPWRLLECQRGAWGTKAAAHGHAASVGRLMDHDYKVFLTDADLSLEVARNIAALFNYTGARQLSFDGLEGNWSTGYGQYGRTLFTKAWYDALSPGLRGTVINDASNPGHFNWHIYTRMNWGEPWYAGFRESQTLYRFKNQVYFERNLMPHMLGWFALRPETSVEDAEWLLARAAGFDAGFALAASLASTAQLSADASSADTGRRFGAAMAILDAVRQWETARMGKAFPTEIKAALRDNTREFHLEAVGKDEWNLCEAHAARFTHDTSRATPTEFTFQNRDGRQSLQWTIHWGGKQPLEGLMLEVNGARLAHLENQTLPAGGSLRFSGGQEAAITDRAWKEQQRVPVDPSLTQVSPGLVRVKVSCVQRSEGKLEVELRTLSLMRRLQAAR